MNAAAERAQVMELVKALPDDQIGYVLRVIENLPRSAAAPAKCGLRAKEKDAWSLAAEEKHALR